MAAADVKATTSKAARLPNGQRMHGCFGTIKTKLQMTEYETYRDALKELTEFIDYYNTSRLHSSLGYLSPSRFESTVPC
jgi:putative transposase